MGTTHQESMDEFPWRRLAVSPDQKAPRLLLPGRVILLLMKRPGVGMFIRCGKATAVLVAKTDTGIQLMDRRVVLLADPAIPDTIQPYHVYETQSGTKADQYIQKLIRRVHEVAEDSIRELYREYAKLGQTPDRAVLVVGSTVDPDTLKNEHIRWHALEGQLFRTAVKDAFASRKVKSVVITSKAIFKTGADILKMNENELKQTIRELGREMQSWRAEDKAAALAAWLGTTKGGIQ